MRRPLFFAHRNACDAHYRFAEKKKNLAVPP
jgi:hypothetical protein